MESCLSISALLLPVSSAVSSKRQSLLAHTNHTGSIVVGMPALPYNIKKGELRTARIRCAAALNARCASGQTQTIAREARTINVTPGKVKPPQIDDNGPGLPPRDNDGNGDNGGGGENFEGGLALLGILGVLDILKEMEIGWLRKNERSFSRA